VLELLAAAGHEVRTCQLDLWGSERYEIPNRSKASLIARGVATYCKLVWRFLRAAPADIVLVLYPGWFDMLVLAPLARLRRMPVLFDPFISLYDTIVSDRKLASSSSLLGRMSRRVDRLSLRWATRVLADTPSHADFYAELAKIPRSRIGVVWLGAQDGVFYPRPALEARDDVVLFYGTFIALQGIDTIIRAAKLLDEDGIVVRIVGSGQEQANVDRLIEELRPRSVEVVGRIPQTQIPDEIARAALCLGVFGTSEKAHRVVPNKVFECAAVGSAIISGDTEALRSAFSPDEVAMVPTGDPDALAKEIRRLLGEPKERKRRATAARDRYVQRFRAEHLTCLLDRQIRLVLSANDR
jgi:glycosyltransferase involved in cell wall biosynthesis